MKIVATASTISAASATRNQPRRLGGKVKDATFAAVPLSCGRSKVSIAVVAPVVGYTSYNVLRSANALKARLEYAKRVLRKLGPPSSRAILERNARGSG